MGELSGIDDGQIWNWVWRWECSLVPGVQMGCTSTGKIIVPGFCMTVPSGSGVGWEFFLGGMATWGQRCMAHHFCIIKLIVPDIHHNLGVNESVFFSLSSDVVHL